MCFFVLNRIKLVVWLCFVFVAFSCSDEGAGITENKIRDDGPLYETLFSISQLKTIHLHITASEWNALLHDYDSNNRNEIYRQADFFYGNNTNSAFYLKSVGFRLRGSSRRRPEAGASGSLHNSTNMLQRTHYKIKFNETFDQNESVYGAPSFDIPIISVNSSRELTDGVSKIILKCNDSDSSYLREVFSSDLFKRFDVVTARAGFVRLYVKIGSEASRYIGVFSLIENIDKTWIRKKYGANSYLFKCANNIIPADLSVVDAGNNSNSGLIGIEKTDPINATEYITWDNSTSPYRPLYDLKTKSDNFILAQNKLNELITLLQGNPLEGQLAALIDVDALLKAQAVSVFLGMWDDYWRNGNNYYLLLRPTDNRWLFIPYNYTTVFQDSADVGNSPPASSSFTNWGLNGVGTPLLLQKVLSISNYQNKFKDYIKQLYITNNNLLATNAVKEAMEQLQTLISSHVIGYDADNSVPYNANLDAMQTFLQIRITVATQEAP